MSLSSWNGLPRDTEQLLYEWGAASGSTPAPWPPFRPGQGVGRQGLKMSGSS
jgi:hypothetical protein